jgi:hypothetical protein
MQHVEQWLLVTPLRAGLSIYTYTDCRHNTYTTLLNTARELQGNVVWTSLKLVLLQFTNLSTWSAMIIVVKMESRLYKTKRVPWFHESRCAVTVQRKLSTVSVTEPPHKFQFTNSTNCLISLAAFVKGKTHGDGHSLKLRWMKFEWLNSTRHAVR